MSQIKLCDIKFYIIFRPQFKNMHFIRMFRPDIFFFLILLKDVKVLECTLALYGVPSFHMCVNLPYLSGYKTGVLSL